MITRTDRIKSAENYLAIKARQRTKSDDPTKRVCIDKEVRDYIEFMAHDEREKKYFRECYDVFQLTREKK